MDVKQPIAAKIKDFSKCDLARDNLDGIRRYGRSKTVSSVDRQGGGGAGHSMMVNESGGAGGGSGGGQYFKSQEDEQNQDQNKDLILTGDSTEENEETNKFLWKGRVPVSAMSLQDLLKYPLTVARVFVPFSLPIL